jgi:hypothetical protein
MFVFLLIVTNMHEGTDTLLYSHLKTHGLETYGTFTFYNTLKSEIFLCADIAPLTYATSNR